MIMHLNLRNKRWIFTDCISRVSVSNLFESFWKFCFDSPFIHAYKLSMMIWNLNEKVFWEFTWRFKRWCDEDLREYFLWASGEWFVELNQWTSSSLSLIRIFFVPSSSSSNFSVIVQFVNPMAKLRWNCRANGFDDDDFVRNLWESCFKFVEIVGFCCVLNSYSCEIWGKLAWICEILTWNLMWIDDLVLDWYWFDMSFWDSGQLGLWDDELVHHCSWDFQSLLRFWFILGGERNCDVLVIFLLSC
jgi:hypothetical protein